MNQSEFDILLKKYLNGACSEAENAEVHTWVEQQLENDVEILDEEEKQVVEKRVWNKIKKKNFAATTIIWRIAASILLLSGIGFYTIQNFDGEADKNLSDVGVEMINTSDEVQNLTLEDGSKVKLNPNSSIKYPRHFGKNDRVVYLKGVAFFNVKRDPSKPFIVRVGKITTEVLGTSFWVNSSAKGKTIEVSVVTGKVSVYENEQDNDVKRNGVILKPNQKIVFNKETKELEASIVENPVLLVPISKNNVLDFEDTKISEVVAKLELLYGIEIIIENPDLKNCVFTGNLNDLPLLTQINLICKTIGANYEQRGVSLFLKGAGCSK